MEPADSPFSNPADIKELPQGLDGSFTWLTQTPLPVGETIGDRHGEALATQLQGAIAAATAQGIQLPTEFVTFMGTPAWHRHLRSAMACYLNLGQGLLPLADGFLLKFLQDQQDCAFWYLYLRAGSQDHCVVSSFEEFEELETATTAEAGYALEESDFYIAETSFERFIARFWIENEILFAQLDNTPLPKMDSQFLDPKFLALYGP